LTSPELNQRLAELEAQMTGETFWNNQEAAQKVINETNDIRGKLDPLARFGKQAEDLQVMLELAAAEPEPMQLQLETEMTRTRKNCSPTSTRLNCALFSTARTTSAIASSPSMPARAAPRRRIGRKCSRACTALV
jgi:protein subunit release factor A